MAQASLVAKGKSARLAETGTKAPLGPEVPHIHAHRPCDKGYLGVRSLTGRMGLRVTRRCCHLQEAWVWDQRRWLRQGSHIQEHSRRPGAASASNPPDHSVGTQEVNYYIIVYIIVV